MSTLSNLMEDQKKTMHEAPTEDHHPVLHLPPPSPPSPWSLSPLRSPGHSLFYTCIASLRRVEGYVHSIGLSQGLVFTSSDSRTIRVWSLNECADLGFIKVKSGEIRSILCCDNMLFTTHKDCKIRVWNFSSGTNFHFQKIMTLPKRNPFSSIFSNNSLQSTHKDKISCMAYDPIEGLLYTGSWDKTVRVWNFQDRKCQEVVFAHEGKINAILIGQGDGSIFTCSSDGSFKIWSKALGFHTLVMTLKFAKCSINALALSSLLSQTTNESKTPVLYSGSSDGLVNFWTKDKDSARYIHGGVLQGHNFSVLCLTAIDNLLLSGSEDTTIRVWRREEGDHQVFTLTHSCLAVLQGHRGPVKCLAACHDSDNSVMGSFLVYTGSLDKTFKVWRVRVVADDNGGKRYDAGDEAGRSSSVKNGDEVWMNKSMSMKYGRSDSCDPVLSPNWVQRRLNGLLSEN